MIDDPLALVVQMIAVLAAGMYPVGFLFGTCSDCCCPACNKCRHYWNRGQDCEISFFGSEFDMEYSFGEYGTVAIPSVGSEPSTGEGNNSLSVPTGNLPAAPNGLTYLEGGPFGGASNFLFPNQIISRTVDDTCGCPCCEYDLFFRFIVRFENDVEAVFDRGFLTPQLCECGESLLGASTDSGWSLSDDIGVNDQQYLNAVIAFLNTVPLSSSLEIEPCDCGACCDDGCEDNVAEGACENWAGVGTACNDDPNPCEEE